VYDSRADFFYDCAADSEHEVDNPPDQYEPEGDDKNDPHRCATGAMDSDVYGQRERPPLLLHKEDNKTYGS